MNAIKPSRVRGLLALCDRCLVPFFGPPIPELNEKIKMSLWVGAVCRIVRSDKGYVRVRDMPDHSKELLVLCPGCKGALCEGSQDGKC